MASEQMDTPSAMSQQCGSVIESSANTDIPPVAGTSLSSRKKRPPIRLSAAEQVRLTWTARQTEPPIETCSVDMQPETEMEIGATPAKLDIFAGQEIRLTPKAPVRRKKKSVKEIIQSRISKEYALSLRLIPFEPSHKSHFQLGEIILRGSKLDAPGLCTNIAGDDSDGNITGAKNAGIYWACKSTDEGSPMHLFWRDPTADDELGFREVTANVPAYVISALSSRHRSMSGAALLCLRECSSPTSLSVTVLLSERALRNIAYRYEAPTKQPNVSMQIIVKFFFGIDYTEMGDQLAIHPDYDRLLYQEVLETQRAAGMLPISDDKLQCPLQVTLREYQREAVTWMVAMETCPPSVGPVELWQPLKDSQGLTVYYNRFSGWFGSRVSSIGNTEGRPPGGILADEMGLGKTLEVISCVLAHPRPGFPVMEDQQGIVLVEDSKTLTQFSCTICSRVNEAKCAENVSSKCPQCWAAETAEKPRPIKSTLIVCPATICEQWTDEINWLVGGDCSLQVFVYGGVSKHGYIPPDRLAEFDLIITTYEVLRKEIHHANIALEPQTETSRFRTPKRYRASPSPLVSVEFWRVALDEAQMVEQCTVSAAQMVLSIPAVNRWCVTGTPIHRGLNDLYGLFVFLRLSPFDEELWFRTLLAEPFARGNASPLINVLSRCFRRMSKAEVWNQLGLPPQHIHAHNLNFMPVEEVFYKSQARECAHRAFRVADRFPQDAIIEKMPRSDMITLLGPLKRLRQACTHPQAVRGAVISLRSSTYSMNDLLTALIKKTVQEAEECHRRIIMSLNGLAGIALLRLDVTSAADFYRQVLWSIQSHKGNVRADPLQQFHTYVNLHKLLEDNNQQLEVQMARTARPGLDRWNPQSVAATSNGYMVQDLAQEWAPHPQIGVYGTPRVPSIPRAPGDDSLMEQAYQVRDKYLKKFIEAQKALQVEVDDAGRKLSELSRQYQGLKHNRWYHKLIDEADSRGDGHRLVKKVREYLLARQTQFGMCLINRFNDCNGLKYLIQSCLDILLESRANLLKVISQFAAAPTREDMQSAIMCHLRPVKKKRAKCRYCLAKEMITAYEGKLFSIDPQFTSKDQLEEEDNELLEDLEDEFESKKNDPLADSDLTKGSGVQKKGHWLPADTEKILTFLASFAKSYTTYPDVAHDGSVQCKYMCALRTEYVTFSKYYAGTTIYVAALDELEMAALRMELAPDDKTFKKGEERPSYIIRRAELEPQAAQLSSTKLTSEIELRKKLGQLFYLRNLEKANSLVTNSNPEECPTCRGVLGERWSVLHCGHSVCLECIELLLKNHCPPNVNTDRQWGIVDPSSVSNVQRAFKSGRNLLRGYQPAEECRHKRYKGGW
ncbi:E3 ubiquitin-protein ligase SHPRH-like isoform X2 [Varroa jacobsoni]|uniref:E3 ubiquitin-protein ligase SHPRH-like isoform X2 n=1 Tax=Varroa jacobsoni TaxID=62625 RepID=UPI000BF285C8|nr:E3 ubiquitin-protein ligase SHPRH-like isoform X2 [Varroa jacobsoni]